MQKKYSKKLICPECGAELEIMTSIYEEVGQIEFFCHCEQCLSDWTGIVPHEMIDLQKKYWG